MKRIVWITPKWPLPANDGARHATTQLLSALAQKGAAVDLLAIVPAEERVSEVDASKTLGLRSACAVRRPPTTKARHLYNLIRNPTRALTLSQYSSPRVSKELQRAASEPETMVVFDGLHAAAWLGERDVSRPPRFIYRAHNVEADLWFRGANQHRGLASRFLDWQGRAVERFEALICEQAEIVFTVSDDDTRRLKELAPKARYETLLIGMEDKPQRTEPADADSILFVGRLDWPPNRDGLRWFLEQVWPNVTRPFTLTIVGSGDGSWLTPYLDEPRIRFLGRVESVEPYYHQAIATLVPIFYGSGTRVKAIESSLFATACIGTEVGVEGIGLEPERDYFPAESQQEWVDSLNALDPDLARERGRNALACVSERYDRDRVAEQFLATVESVLGPQVRGA